MPSNNSNFEADDALVIEVTPVGYVVPPTVTTSLAMVVMGVSGTGLQEVNGSTPERGVCGFLPLARA
jgi:hypothetical protein